MIIGSEMGQNLYIIADFAGRDGRSWASRPRFPRRHRAAFPAIYARNPDNRDCAGNVCFPLMMILFPERTCCSDLEYCRFAPFWDTHFVTMVVNPLTVCVLLCAGVCYCCVVVCYCVLLLYCCVPCAAAACFCCVAVCCCVLLVNSYPAGGSHHLMCFRGAAVRSD